EGDAWPQAAIAAPANGAPTPSAAAADFRNDLRVVGRRKAPAGGLSDSSVIELARPGIEDDTLTDRRGFGARGALPDGSRVVSDGASGRENCRDSRRRPDPHSWPLSTG